MENAGVEGGGVLRRAGAGKYLLSPFFCYLKPTQTVMTHLHLFRNFGYGRLHPNDRRTLLLATVMTDGEWNTRNGLVNNLLSR